MRGCDKKIYFILRAGAVVTWDVPPYVVVGGVSTTPLKKVEEECVQSFVFLKRLIVGGNWKSLRARRVI